MCSTVNGTQYKDVKWGVGVQGASFHGFVNDGSLWNLFWCFLCIFYYRNSTILQILGQFENLGFVVMSTRENIRLIARAPCPTSCIRYTHGRIQRGGGQGVRTPLEIKKIYIGFLSNIGPDPLKNHKKKNVKVGPLWQNFLDPRKWFIFCAFHAAVRFWSKTGQFIF